MALVVVLVVVLLVLLLVLVVTMVLLLVMSPLLPVLLLLLLTALLTACQSSPPKAEKGVMSSFIGKRTRVVSFVGMPVTALSTFRPTWKHSTGGSRENTKRLPVRRRTTLAA